MSNRLAAIAVAGIGLIVGVALDATNLGAARPLGTQTDQAGAPKAATAAPPSRALFDQYCVTCHNDRVKTGGLSLEKIDPADAGRHAEILEKVVRKLRTGTMP